MSCQSCAAFLHDFLLTSLPENPSFQKDLKLDQFPHLVPGIVRWILPIYSRVETELLLMALTTASRITRRGRTHVEYQQIILSATFNIMCFQLPMLRDEVEYMKVIVVEKNLFRGRNANKLLRTAADFLSYLLLKSFLYLHHVHDDHVRPKGLYTPIHSLGIDHQGDDEATLSDRDTAHQKEILDEVDLSDLYS